MDKPKDSLQEAFRNMGITLKAMGEVLLEFGKDEPMMKEIVGGRGACVVCRKPGIGIDDNGRIFCSSDCADKYYGITERDKKK